MAQVYPLQVHNVYADLLSRHLVRERPSYEGSIRKKKKRNKEFWEANRYFGSKKKTVHIGPDNEETRNLVEKAKTEQLTDKAFQRSATRLVQMIAKAGLARPDAKTGAVLRALSNAGAFRFGAVLIGTHAFRIYESVLGVDLGGASMSTEDVDIARDHEIQLATASGPDPKISDVLSSLNLTPSFSASTPEGVWQWVSKESGLLVEFLTPKKSSRRNESSLVELESLGVHAMQLSYLEFLLADPIDAVALYREGVLLKVPNPTRFAVHKLIVAAVRGSQYAVKSVKDRLQSALLLEVLLEQQPFEVEEVWQEAMERGPKWRRALVVGAKGLPQKVTEQLSELEIG